MSRSKIYNEKFIAMVGNEIFFVVIEVYCNNYYFIAMVGNKIFSLQ